MNARVVWAARTLAILGAVLVVFAAWHVYPPAALAVAGVLMLVTGMGALR